MSAYIHRITDISRNLKISDLKMTLREMPER